MTGRRMSPHVLQTLEERLRVHAGLELPAWIVESRAQTRMSALGIDAEAYLERFDHQGSGELDALVEAVRVGETRFFRHRPHVAAVEELIIPDWIARGVSRLRVWSAGCATGEEAYTLALVVHHGMRETGARTSVLATDVSADAIAIAQRGLYPRESTKSVPREYADGFVEDGQRVRIAPEIRSLVTFEVQNLAETAQRRGFELIFCCNVLIYFEAESRRAVLERLVAALSPGGYLFVGYSESLRNVEGLAPVQGTRHSVWQKPLLRSHDLAPVSKPTKKKSLPPPRKEVPRKSERPKAKEPAKVSNATIAISGSDANALSEQIMRALRSRDLSTLTVDLDSAEFLDEKAAAVLRRATAAARAAGVTLELRASRPGTKRWVRRHALGEEQA
jgi:chemotaxis protein methyltransferase CheR